MDASVAQAKAKGGEVVHGPRSMGGGRMAVVRDPAGAMIGLWAD
jgi:predicted enzyme related to lactoylglutathione lyase